MSPDIWNDFFFLKCLEITHLTKKKPNFRKQYLCFFVVVILHCNKEAIWEAYPLQNVCQSDTKIGFQIHFHGILVQLFSTFFSLLCGYRLTLLHQNNTDWKVKNVIFWHLNHIDHLFLGKICEIFLRKPQKMSVHEKNSKNIFFCTFFLKYSFDSFSPT